MLSSSANVNRGLPYLLLSVVAAITTDAVSCQVVASEAKRSEQLEIITLSHATFKRDSSSLVRAVSPIDK